MELGRAYDILGIGEGATEQEAKAALRRLISRWHPDRNASAEAEARSREINQAFQRLQQQGFPVRRSAFAHGPDGPEPAPYAEFRRPGGGAGASGRRPWQEAPAPPGRAPRRGRTIARTVTLALEEAAAGIAVELSGTVRDNCAACEGHRTVGLGRCLSCHGQGGRSFQVDGHFGRGDTGHRIECAHCQGTGRRLFPCDACDGAGTAATGRDYRVTVLIPPGTRHGETVVLAGQGGRGTGDPALAGELRVTVALAPHELFFFDGDDVLACRVPVALLDYALGTRVTVPTPWGAREVEIAAPQRVVELAQAGFPDRAGGRGPLRVHVGLIEGAPDAAVRERLRAALGTLKGPAAPEVAAWQAAVTAWAAGRS